MRCLRKYVPAIIVAAAPPRARTAGTCSSRSVIASLHRSQGHGHSKNDISQPRSRTATSCSDFVTTCDYLPMPLGTAMNYPKWVIFGRARRLASTTSRTKCAAELLKNTTSLFWDPFRGSFLALTIATFAIKTSLESAWQALQLPRSFQMCGITFIFLSFRNRSAPSEDCRS